MCVYLWNDPYECIYPYGLPTYVQYCPINVWVTHMLCGPNVNYMDTVRNMIQQHEAIEML